VIGLRRTPRRYGRDWVQRILDGVQKVYRPGETLVVAPRRHMLPIRAIVLFNHRDRAVRASLRLRCSDGSLSVDVDVPAGGARWLVPRDVGAEREDLFRECQQILVEARAGGPWASTYFVSFEQLHVFLMNEAYRDELPDLIARYLSADFAIVQGPFERRTQDSFPDHHDAQRRLYDHARARFPESRRILLAPRATLPAEQRVPRTIHWIWLKSPRPIRLDEPHLRMMHSWARHNPSFGLCLWTDFDDLGPAFKNSRARRLFDALFGDRLRLRGPGEIERLFRTSTLGNAAKLADVFEGASNVAPRSDILRLMVLTAEGGLYCDMNDTECLAPLHEYCDRFSFVVGLDIRTRIHNAIVGSAPGHPIVRDWLASVEFTADALNGELAASASVPEYFFAVLRAGGPYTLSLRLCALLDEGRLGPDALLLPFPFFHNPRTDEPTPLSVAIHHSAMSWVPPGGPRVWAIVRRLGEIMRPRVPETA